ncbi:meiotically up-regulated protein 190 [Pseudohyphozyma bogoriensis]|nr:meiotically up-regulated protein 190 [Pseudohyphozyma bogoriensis]
MAGVQDADVQEVIDATKTMDLRRESQPSQVRPSIPSDQSAVLEAAFARARKRAAQRPPPSPSASVSSNEARRPSYDAAVSARSGNLFPLKQAPRKNPSKHDLHSIPTPMSPDGKGMLPPITHIPPISFGLDTPWEPSEPDVASLRTVGSGSSG